MKLRIVDQTANRVRSILTKRGSSASAFAKITNTPASTVNYRIAHLEGDLDFLRDLIDVYGLTDSEILEVVKR